MTSMNCYQRLQAATELKEPDRIPYAPLVSFFAAQYYGVTCADFLYNLEKRDRIMDAAYEEFGPWDMVYLEDYFDIDTKGLGMPMKIKMPGKDLPVDSMYQYIEEPVMTPEQYDDILSMGFSTFVREKLLPIVRPGIDMEKLDEKVTAHQAYFKSQVDRWAARGVPLQYGAVNSLPFDTLTFIRSYNEFVYDLFYYPEKLDEVLKLINEETIEGLIKGVEFSGIRRVYIGGYRSCGNLISPKQFERFVMPYLYEMVERLREKNIVSLLHFDSDWGPQLPYLAELPRGCCILELDGFTDIFKAKKIVGNTMCIMGDIPITMLSFGTPQDIKNYCYRLFDEVAPGGGFILASGCVVPQNAKPENMKAVCEALAERGKY